jgi:hypothetical protein
MNTEKIYSCLLCKKDYTSYMGFWKHNKSKHPQKNTQDKIEKVIDKPIEIQVENSQTCKYCGKEFYNYKNCWRHEKYNCKINKNNKIIQSKNNQIIENQNNIQTQIIENQNIQNNNIQNNNITNNINITFNKIGCEDISILNQDEIEEIVDNGLNCVIKLIELMNFNKEYPQNHTFCTTSLNNKYVSTLNTETNEIEKQRKVDIFDNVLRYALTHIDMLKDNITNSNKKKEFDNKINDLYKIIGDTSYRKIYHEQLNVLSYNKRNIINNTWEEQLKDYFNITV